MLLMLVLSILLFPAKAAAEVQQQDLLNGEYQILQTKCCPIESVVQSLQLVWCACQEVEPAYILLYDGNRHHGQGAEVGYHGENNQRYDHIHENCGAHAFFSIHASLLQLALETPLLSCPELILPVSQHGRS